MKNLKLNWTKVSPSENYLKIPNKLVTDVSVNPMAFALLLTIISNKNEYFKIATSTLLKQLHF